MGVKKSPGKKKSPGGNSPGTKSSSKKGSESGTSGTTLSASKLKSGVNVLHGFVPRVWCTLGQKVQVKNYEPVDIQFGISEDVRPGESIEMVRDRVISFAKKTIKPLIMEAQAAKKKFAKEN